MSGDLEPKLPTYPTQAQRDEANRLLHIGENASGMDYEALPLTYDFWQTLDAEEKGAALEGYMAIVTELRKVNSHA